MREALAYNLFQDVENEVDNEREVQLAAQLEELLERLRPEKVTPTWIIKRAPGLYKHLIEALPKEKGQYDWSPIISRLDGKWKNRWSMQKRVEKERSLQDEVGALTSLLEAEQPETFGPQWLSGHDVALNWRLNKMARDKNGKLDWSVVINLLDEKWRKRWSWKKSEKGRAIKDEVAELTKLLESEQPETFGPKWISDHNEQLFFRLVTHAKDENGKRDWSRVVALLGEEWRPRWKLIKGERSMNLEAEVNGLTALLEKENPSVVTPSWIREADGTLYGHLLKALRDEQGGHDWSRVTAFLDDTWRERWSNEARTGQMRSLKDEVREVETILEAENPPIINPTWIKSRDSGLYGRLKRQLSSVSLSTQDGSGWKPFVALLGEKWQSRWLTREQTSEKASMEGIEFLTQILEEKNPNFFSPKWIEHNDQSLYRRLAYKFRTVGGGIDWAKIISKLDKKWADRWGIGISETEKHLPKFQYTNEEEIDRVFETHKDKLYTLLTLLKPEDKQERNIICQELIALAQKGNFLAEERLMDILKPLVQEWMDEFEDFSVYKNDPERVHVVLKRCIYLSEADAKMSFIGYVFSSLRMGARGLKNQIARSLDQPRDDEDGRNLYDLLASPPEDED